MKRMGVFIDGSSFYFALKRNNFHTRVDYHELSQALTGPDRSLVRTYYYNSTYDPLLFPEQWKSQQPFFDSLAKMPFLEVRLGRIIPTREGGFKEKGSNVRMAVDMIYYASQKRYDAVIVFTEDTDLAPALNLVRELGVNVEIGFFPDVQPRELVKMADLVVPLNDVFEKYGSQIFPEENIGNRVEDGSAKRSSGAGLKNEFKKRK
jgi:uncharacterized LabA/DUF88 family protein